MIITWVLYWPETLPPALAFPAAEAHGKGWLVLPDSATDPSSGKRHPDQLGQGQWFSGLYEGLSVFFCFFVIKKKKTSLIPLC